MGCSPHAPHVPSRVPYPCYRSGPRGPIGQADHTGPRHPRGHPPQLAATRRYRPRPPAGTKQSGLCRAPRGARPCPAARIRDRDLPPGRDVARRGGRSRPKGAHPVIDRLVDAGAPTSTCCRLLGVSRQGYYRYGKRPTSAAELRRRWLTGLVREIHVACRGTYRYRRIHAEFAIRMNIPCSIRLISVLITRAGIGGLPGPAKR